MRSYFGFIKRYPAVLGFGFLCVFWGNYGQSFFISWFGGAIQQSLGLSASAYGSAYSLATLLSGLTIVWAGALIDKIRLNIYVIMVAVGLAVASGILSIANSLVTMCVGFYLLRLFGQALLPHTGMTTLARFFDNNRGKAVSVAGSAFPAGEVLLPVVAVWGISYLGWRGSFQLISALTVLVFIPMILSVLKISQLPLEAPSNRGDKQSESSSVTRLLLTDKRYWLALPALTACPFMITGVFIHQDFILQQKAWSPSLMASSFILYGVVHWGVSLVSGTLVDRYSARKLLPWLPWCLLSSLLLLSCCSSAVIALVFMALLGAALGLTQPVLAALWAEIYPAQYLGAIKSLNMTAVVISTSIAPILLGVLIDAGFSVATVFAGCSAYIVVAAILVKFSYK